MSQPIHAMPVMLGALAVLAVAYRYYSAFLAAKVAALDDSRITPAHEFNDGQNYPPDEQVRPLRPPLCGDLGRWTVDRAGPGDPVWLLARPDLAGRRRLPGRGGAGYDGPGRIGPARAGEAWRAWRGPRSARWRAWPRRWRSFTSSSSRWRGWGSSWSRRSAARRFAMKAGTTLTYPPTADDQDRDVGPDGNQDLSTSPPRFRRIRFGDGPDESMTFHEPFRLSVPTAEPPRKDRSTPTVSRSYWVGSCPSRGRNGSSRVVRGGRSRSPARSRSPSWSAGTCTEFRKGKVVEASILGAVGGPGVHGISGR